MTWQSVGPGGFVVLASQLIEATGTREDVDACEWKVCTGKDARESADYWFARFCETYAFVNVRHCSERPVMFSQPSGPKAVVYPIPAGIHEAGGGG